tara:strand:+ start:180 stop:593 length:414 start_codon:yes stop_codon:yes gene_type:complete
MKYTVKIWLFTIFLSPLLIAFILGAILNFSDVKEIFNSFDIFWVMMIVGLIFSVPAMAVFYILLNLIQNRLDKRLIKIILSFYSFISVWLTFYLFDSGLMTDWLGQTLWVLIYSLTIVVGVWIFNISDLKKTVHNNV